MALVGIGVDLCSIERMKRALGRNGFAERVFSKSEIAYANAHTKPERHFASAFAAREALAKAGGWGIGSMGLKSCSIERTKQGPSFIFSDKFQSLLTESGIGSARISISHEGDMVVAMVVLEGTGNKE